jgi:ATP-dependent RNA helicase RhlE
MQFETLNLIEPILKALKNEGYVMPTPIQEQAIPPLLEGKDLLGCAQTGTGKTAAFAIPIMQILYNEQKMTKAPITTRTIKALILTPTRELAAQIGESFSTYGKYLSLKNYVIFGGVSQKPQTDALYVGIDILVATPGRLLDLINQKYVNLSHVKFLVLDEADHMLDMGFINDVKKIIALIPEKRQTMLFSATMPNEIDKLANTILRNPIKIAVTPISSPVDAIKQVIYYVNKKNKRSLLIELLKNREIVSALVFSRTKHGANKITDELIHAGIQAEAIHGNKSQAARQLALRKFKARQIRVLVATDIAARGIDINELAYVINFDLPEVPETYVHRIGRTGRAGLEGVAVSFCDEEERGLLKDIQKLISREIPVVEEHPYAMPVTDFMPINDVAKNTFSNKTRGRSRNQEVPVVSSRAVNRFNAVKHQPHSKNY